MKNEKNISDNLKDQKTNTDQVKGGNVPRPVEIDNIIMENDYTPGGNVAPMDDLQVQFPGKLKAGKSGQAKKKGGS